MTIYRGEYTDIEMDDSGGSLQQIKRIDIIDTESNPYNVVLTEEVGVTNTVFTFTFLPLPATATGTVIEYTSDGGLNWFQNFGGTTSPRTITLPNNTYFFSFTIQIPGGYIYWTNESSIIPLEMADSPCNDIVIDNAEDKFTAIRARQLNINIHTSNTINLETFASGGDNRFKVNWYIDEVLNFTGFLSLSDLSVDLQPNPNVLSLVALDGLGYLSDIPLTDYNEEVPQNEQKILDLILWALAKTGLTLNLRVIYNIREITASTLNDDTNGQGHFFWHEYVDAKTFEENVGELTNCYDVITKLLGNSAVLFQYLGEWRIVRIDEMNFVYDAQTAYCWDWFGQFIEKTTETNIASVGVGEDYSFMNDDARKLAERLFKESRLNYKFETPQEIPCNVDFERGDLIEEISPTESNFDIECWEKLVSLATDEPVTTGIYIRRVYFEGYETDRYVILEQNPDFTFIMSAGIGMQAKDKFQLTIDSRLSADISGSGFYRDRHVQARLYGNDGTFWTHAGKTSASDERKWVQCTSTFRTNQQFFAIEGDASDDLTQSANLYDGDSAELPVDGTVKILIYRSGLWGDVRDTYINMGFTYIPYINGSYQKYSSQQHIVAQTAATRNIREEEIFIDNAPSRLFKGALQIYNGTDYELAGLFYDAARNPDGTTEGMKFGQLIGFDVWNQVNRNFTKVEGTVDHSLPAPSLLNKYRLTDSDASTDNRLFVLLHYDYDSYLCEWQVFFFEVANSLNAKSFDGYSFKYLTK